jgi:hypothetical protein
MNLKKYARNVLLRDQYNNGEKVTLFYSQAHFYVFSYNLIKLNFVYRLHSKRLTLIHKNFPLHTRNTVHNT